MKKLWLFSVVVSCCIPLFAAAKKAELVAPTRPTTHVAVVHPTTPSSSSPRLTTRVSVPKPVTQTPVVHPLTPGSATAQAVAAGFGEEKAATPASAPAVPVAAVPSKSSAGSYSPSYKNAKKLGGDNKTPSVLPPAASVKSGLGISGAGDAERAAVAAASAKPEVEPATMESMMKKANIPADIASKLKQRNFESTHGGKKK